MWDWGRAHEWGRGECLGLGLGVGVDGFRVEAQTGGELGTVGVRPVRVDLLQWGNREKMTQRIKTIYVEVEMGTKSTFKFYLKGKEGKKPVKE